MTRPHDSHRRRWRPWQKTIISTVIVLIIILLVGLVHYGSFGAMWVAAAGGRLYLEQREFDLGKLEGGSLTRIKVSVQNVTAEKLRIVGSRSSCGCTVISKLPMDIPPYACCVLPVHVRAPREGALATTMLLITDRIEEQFHITVRGEVVGEPAACPTATTAKGLSQNVTRSPSGAAEPGGSGIGTK